MKCVVCGRQRGATLLVVLVFLIVLMLVVVSIIQVGNVNTRVVGNMQMQKEAEAAAQLALEETISYDFAKLPVTQDIQVDISNSGQGGAAYKVTVKPTCLTVSPIKSVDLDISKADDHGCFVSGAGQNTGVIGAMPSGLSLCSEATWDLEATVTSPQSDQPVSTLIQGVNQRVDPGANC